MDSFREFIRNWFGFTRRERRSSFILLIIIVIVSVIRFVVPDSTISVEMIPMDLKDDPFDTIQPAKRDLGRYKPVNELKYRSKKTLLEINTCDSLSLVALPGIGPVLSARIIKYRNLVGGFWSVEQLKEVYGISAETYEKVSSMLYADTLKIRKIKINKASYRDLIRHPYLRKEEVGLILKYRDLQGGLKGSEELIKNNLVGAETIIRIRYYLDFEQ